MTSDIAGVTHQLTQAGMRPLPNAPMCRHTSFGIGGPATIMVSVSSAHQAVRALNIARTAGLPVFILGGGTNLLVSDSGFDGLVIKTDFRNMHFEAEQVTVGASESTATLVDEAVSRGLAGLEFAAGLPGTVGGAVAGNAGCYGASFGDRLLRARVVTPAGEVRLVGPRFFDCAYRKTAIQEKGVIVVEVVLSVTPGDPAALRDTAIAHIAARHRKHPAKAVKTAGSYFKNLPPQTPGGRRRATGALLEQVGGKTCRQGDAVVFEKHANILVNRGTATARDMLRLEAQLKQRVWDTFGLMIEPEVRFVGDRPHPL